MGFKIIFCFIKMLSLIVCLSGTESIKYPKLKDPIQLTARLKNIATNGYLSVMRNKTGEFELSFKVPVISEDADATFNLYYYTDAEAAEKKIVLLVHNATSLCLNMTDVNTLQLVPLLYDAEGVLENPLITTEADSRFFHISKTGSFYSLNFLMGDGNTTYFLAANSANIPVIKKLNSLSSYPRDILFSIKELDE